MLEAVKVQCLDLFTIVEVCPHGVGLTVVLMEDIEVEGLGPPIVGFVCGSVAAVDDGTFSGTTIWQVKVSIRVFS